MTVSDIVVLIESALQVFGQEHLEENSDDGRRTGRGLHFFPSRLEDGRLEIELWPYLSRGWDKIRGSAEECAAEMARRTGWLD